MTTNKDPRHHIRLLDLVTLRHPDGTYSDVATVVDDRSPNQVCLDWPMPLGPVAVWVSRDDVRCGF